MTTELHWLILTLLMTSLLWVPYVLDRFLVRGTWKTLGDTQPEGTGAQSLWAKRAIRAHQNAIENLAIFAPAVLALHFLGISTPATRAAVLVYFFARLAHYIVYTAGIPFARTLTFATAWACQLALIFSLLHWI